MLEKIDAVIFDLDGSMVDSMWIWRSIDKEYLGKFGITLPDNLQACIEGMSFSDRFHCSSALCCISRSMSRRTSGSLRSKAQERMSSRSPSRSVSCMSVIVIQCIGCFFLGGGIQSACDARAHSIKEESMSRVWLAELSISACCGSGTFVAAISAVDCICTSAEII